LVINGELSQFQQVPNLGKILKREGQAYFDRTRYISVLDTFRDKPVHFFRPRRFGKSLTANMLAHFYGLQHRQEHESLYEVRNHAAHMLCWTDFLVLIIIGSRCTRTYFSRKGDARTILHLEI